MKFYKYIGAGNDFLVFDYEETKDLDLSSLAKKACNRHFGLGADGILLAKEEKGIFEMVYYNSDGSRGEMCGNGLRCFVKYLLDKGLVKDNEFIVNSLAGPQEVRIIQGTKGDLIEVKMSEASFLKEDIGLDLDGDQVFNLSLRAFSKTYTYTALLLGVPHMVIFVDDIREIDINKLGPYIENMDIFKKKINVNFVEIINRTSIKIYTWERGAGRTLGCGTGSSSAALVGNILGYLDKEVDVFTEGGSLRITIENDHRVRMLGSAEKIAKGQIYIGSDEIGKRKKLMEIL